MRTRRNEVGFCFWLHRPELTLVLETTQELGGIMKLRWTLMAALACASTTASAQMFERIILEACYDPNLRADPKAMQAVSRLADKAFEKYIALARSSQSLDRVFTQNGIFTGAARRQAWVRDGVPGDPRTARDPWIERAVRFERIGLLRSNDGLGARGQWRAIGADGQVLGIYDAHFLGRMSGYGIRKLQLYSASAAVQPEPVKAFCLYPGDIEERQAKKANATRR